MTDMYQVTADCAYVTVDTMSGRAKTLAYRGALIPADAPELKHLLNSGMVEKVGGGTGPGLNADGGLGPAQPAPAVSDAGTSDGDPDEARRADARQKLAELGGAPDGRSSEAVWVEYAVQQGLDRAEAEKAGKAELMATLKRGK